MFQMATLPKTTRLPCLARTSITRTAFREIVSPGRRRNTPYAAVNLSCPNRFVRVPVVLL